MSYVEQTRDWTEQERLEWVKIYHGDLDIQINSWIPEYAIDYKKKCCDNCEYFDISINKGDSSCLKDVFNSFDTDCYIKDSDTFYCSYHKFKD